ncbi:MAG: amidohydrolase family protein, partial [Acidobacteria bacterium]|nr:amidohydrolase family protein [Acidobacteriota bacterium]
TLTVPAEMVQFPDLIVHNAKIVTMDDLSPTGPPGSIFQAMAIRGDQIQFLGSNAQVLRYAGPRTRKIDLQGRTVVPGLINTHIHLHGGYLSRWARNNPQEVSKFMRRFRVAGNTFEELTLGIELAIKESMGQAPPGQWATIGLPGRGKYGVGIGTLFLNQKQMTRERLDTLAPLVPVYISSEGEYLMNTAARDAFMDLFNVDHTDENEGITMVNPKVGGTLLVEQYFRTRVPLMADIIEDGLKHFAALGFTGFSSHIIGFSVHDAYMKLSREDRMPVRFGFAHRACQQMAVDIPGCFARLGDMAGMGNKYFWNVGVTLGALDFDAPAICTTMEAATPEIKATEKCNVAPGTPYNEAIYTAFRSHLRFVVNHVMGDKSMDHFMDILERAMQDDPSMDLDYVRSRRYSADHCGWYPRSAQIPRMAKLGMIFSCASKEIDDGGFFIPKVYKEQYADRIGPIKSMLEGGLMVANEGRGDGYDDPHPTTFAQFFPYMTRKRSDGVAMAPQEAVDRVQLLKMSTSYAAAYVLKEKEIGTLEPGKFADFVVFDKDYFTVPEAEIPSVIPLMVVLGGKTTVLREELANEWSVPAVGPQINFQFELEPRDRGEWDFTEM